MIVTDWTLTECDGDVTESAKDGTLSEFHIRTIDDGMESSECPRAGSTTYSVPTTPVSYDFKELLDFAINDESNLDPDGELDRDIRAAINRTPYPLQSVGVIVTQRVVILLGRVKSYYLKQVAQEAVKVVPGVVTLGNHLVVDD